MTMTRAETNTRLKRDWSKEAISLALKGEWKRAAEVNQALLSLFADDVDAMNRLGKALMELDRFDQARQVLEQVLRKSPYNAIAKKNLARLTQLEISPAAGKQLGNAGAAAQWFIAESGKSGVTILQRPAAAQLMASITPGEPASLVANRQALVVYVRNGEYLGQVEPRLARRLLRLIDGGNHYEAAVVGVNDWSISLVIRETYRHPSLHNIASFPTSRPGQPQPQMYLDTDLARYLEEDGLDDDEEEWNGYPGYLDSESEWDE